MIIKKETVSKKDGKKEVTFTTDKEGWKIVMKGGQPQEVKMTPEEKANRDHGANTNGKGAVGSSNAQKGISRTNKEAETVYKQKQEEKKPFEEAACNIAPLAKRVETLQNKLKKAKLDYTSALLSKKSAELEQKEKYYKQAEKYMMLDRKKLKDKNNFFVVDTEEHKDNTSKDVKEPEEAETVETGNLDKKPQTEPVKESFQDKLNKIDIISKTLGITEKQSSGDVLDRINKKLFEAGEDEEEDKKKDEKDPVDDILNAVDKGPEEGDKTDSPSGEDKPAEDNPPEEDKPEDATDQPEEDKDAITPQDNEVQRQVLANKFDVDANNAYDFYDFVVDKLSDETAIKALNAEYEAIPENRRKVTTARQLFDRVVKRTNLSNKKEADNLNTELSGDEGGGEEPTV